MKVFKLLCFIVLLTACSPSRIIEPLAVGERRVQFGTGGNFIDAENSFTHPAPSVSVAILKGLDSNVSTYSGIHVSSFLYDYVHVEVGGLYGLRSYVPEQRFTPGISLSFGFQLGSNLMSEIRAWPETCLNFYLKPFRDETLLYLGIANYFEVLNRVPPEKKQDRHWLAAPFLGVDLDLERMESILKLEYRPFNFTLNEDFQSFSSFYYPGQIIQPAFFITLTKEF